MGRLNRSPVYRQDFPGVRKGFAASVPRSRKHDQRKMGHPPGMNDLSSELNGRLELLRQQGLYRELRQIISAQSSKITTNGKTLLNFSSNDYLGLANEPALKE